jgi:integrase
MCELILGTGIRRAEACGWRVDTLPKRKSDWQVNDENAPAKNQKVSVQIKYGTKGPSFGEDHGDKIGPTRSIWISLSLALKLHSYFNSIQRRNNLRNWVSSATNLIDQRNRIQSSVHLFLDATGQRISARVLYRFWTKADKPVARWHPHLGRDWWSCQTLWRELENHENIKHLDNTVAAALLESSALSIIRLVIQPQLGHVDPETTLGYLEWAAARLGIDLGIIYDNEIRDVEDRIEFSQSK